MMINSGVGMLVTTDALALVLPELLIGICTKKVWKTIGLGVQLRELVVTRVVDETGAAEAGVKWVIDWWHLMVDR